MAGLPHPIHTLPLPSGWSLSVEWCLLISTIIIPNLLNDLISPWLPLWRWLWKTLGFFHMIFKQLPEIIIWVPQVKNIKIWIIFTAFFLRDNHFSDHIYIKPLFRIIKSLKSLFIRVIWKIWWGFVKNTKLAYKIYAMTYTKSIQLFLETTLPR